MNKIILTDIDGVFLDWITSFNNYMDKNGYPIRTDDDLTKFELEDRYHVPDKKIIYEHLEKFNGNSWEFGCIKPIEDSINCVTELSNLGYRFIAITSCTNTVLSNALRRANLYTHFGDVFEEIHCLDSHASKKPYLAKFQPTIWIEDKPSNALDGLEFGHKCVLLESNLSKKIFDSRIQKCKNWIELKNYIIAEKE